jgi:hypothetical protein
MMHRNLIAFFLCLLLATGAVALINEHKKNVNQDGVLSVTSQESPAPISLSPTETLRAYYKAASNKDTQRMKQYLSQGTMKLMKLGAEKMGKSLDDALSEEPPAPLTKFSNEKIKQDTATVDISAEGLTVTMPFVKEDGLWKIAMDKFIEELKANLAEKP